MKKARIISLGLILYVTYSYERHLWVTVNGSTYKDSDIEIIA